MRLTLPGAMLLVMGGCVSPGQTLNEDAGGDLRDAAALQSDASVTDAGVLDNAVLDSAALDSVTLDSAMPDAAAPDGARPDAVAPDTNGAPRCVGEDLPGFYFEVSGAEESRRVPLSALEAGRSYRTLRLEFEFNPVSWNGTCWNPFRSPPADVAVHQSVVELSRGASANWCHGGNLYWSTLRGPSNNVHWVRSFYKPADDGRCTGITGFEFTILEPARQTLSTGVFHTARYELDVEQRSIEMQLGDSTWSGPLDPDLVITNDGGVLHAVFSFNDWSECYDTNGDPDPSADCCWRPSTGWIYRGLSYEACE